MPWPFRKPGSARGAGARGAGTGEPEAHASLALAALSEWLVTVPAPRVLDLSCAVGANLDFFARFAGRLKVLDLFASLRRGRAPGRFEEAPAELLAEVLQREAGDYDLILVWDVLDYLPRPALPVLGTELARLSSPGARVLILVSGRPEIPAEPVPFRILDDRNLSYALRAPQMRKSPRWPPGLVQQALAGFSVDRSYLLRHGVQEYLLARNPA